MDIEMANGIKKKAKFGTADFLIDLENRRSIKVSKLSNEYLFLYIFMAII